MDFFFTFIFPPSILAGKKKWRKRSGAFQGGAFQGVHFVLKKMPPYIFCRGQISLNNVPSRYTEKILLAL
jgi:hypothetical protein